jgi:hypothetical protein
MFEEAAKARAAEVMTLEHNNHMCGAVYLAGYVVECKLKELLSKAGKSFPRTGSAGHDLKALWQDAGLRIDDLNGHRKVFIDTWNVSIRYSASLPAGHDAKELLKGARELAGMVAVRTRRTRDVRRRR